MSSPVAPAAPVPPEYLDQVDFILVNELEGRAIAEASGIEDIARDALPKALADRHGATCVLTLGGEGVIAAKPNREWKVSALSVDNLVDTTGAGDAFAGCLASELYRGAEFEEALRWGPDAVYLLRVQMERQEAQYFPSLQEYHRVYGVTQDRFARIRDNGIYIMHPGPVNRGVELCHEVMDYERSLINQQVENGIAARMAVLYSLKPRTESGEPNRE